MGERGLDYPKALRWVVTHINPEGCRVMTFARQGRNTHATKAHALHSIRQLNSPEADNDIPGVFGVNAPGSFEPRQVKCWPNNHDPIAVYQGH